MKYLRVGPVGHERPVVLDRAENPFDLTPITSEIDGAFWAGGGPERVRKALEAGQLPRTDIDGERIGAPIDRPAALYCIGYNYADHAAESGVAEPADPVVLAKSPHTVVGPYDALLLPPGSTRTDWEAEVAVVIGARARYLPDARAARGCIAGLVLSNDVSERDYQFGDAAGQFTKGKSCETFNPLGPWVVALDDIADPSSLHLASRVNGESRQSASTAGMIFDVFELVHRISQFLVLEPGDLINSGTPPGVAYGGHFPYLAEGDVVEVEESTCLGSQRVVCRRATASAAG